MRSRMGYKDMSCGSRGQCQAAIVSTKYYWEWMSVRDAGRVVLVLIHVASGLFIFFWRLHRDDGEHGPIVCERCCGRFSTGRGECAVYGRARMVVPLGDPRPHPLSSGTVIFCLQSALLPPSSSLQLPQQAQSRAHHPTSGRGYSPLSSAPSRDLLSVHIRLQPSSPSIPLVTHFCPTQPQATSCHPSSIFRAHILFVPNTKIDAFVCMMQTRLYRPDMGY